MATASAPLAFVPQSRSVELKVDGSFSLSKSTSETFRGYRRLKDDDADDDSKGSLGDMMQYFTTRGHVGKVLCVNCGTGCEYIVSGGEDNTMRVWFKDDTSQQYHFTLDGIDYVGKVTKAEGVDSDEEDNNNVRVMTHQLRCTYTKADPSTGQSAMYLTEMSVCLDEMNQVITGSDGREVEFERVVTHQASNTYRLCAVLDHDNEPEAPENPEQVGDIQSRGVQSVACCGLRGPMISGTSSGNVYFLRLLQYGGDVMSLEGLHDAGINDICAANEDPVHKSAASSPSRKVEEAERQAGTHGPWIVATASADGQAKVIRVKIDDDNILSMEPCCEPLKHDGAVSKVRYICYLGSLRFDARLATCARDAAYLWDLKGTCLRKLSVPEAKEMRDLAVAPRDTGTAVLAGGHGIICVWILDPAHDEPAEKPVAEYKFKGSGIDVDQGGDLTEFFLHLTEDSYSIAVRHWLVAEPFKMNRIPREWWDLLVKPGMEKITATCTHDTRVTSFLEAEDDVEGPILLTTGENGTVFTWAVQGPHKGDILGQLRSLSRLEIATPPALLILTFFQVAQFAFRPPGWPEEVRSTIDYGSRFAMFGFVWDLDFSIDRGLLISLQVDVLVTVMICYLLIEVVGLFDRLEDAQRYVQSHPRFRAENFSGNIRCGRMHLLRSVVTFGMTIVRTFVWVCCTVGVAPIFQLLASSVYCMEADDGQWFLVKAGGRNVQCHMWRAAKWLPPVVVAQSWGGDWSYYPIFRIALGVVYFIGLIPYAVVAGDCSYIQWEELLHREDWYTCAIRKATVLHLGMFHQVPENVCRALIIELASKAVLPVIANLPNPIIQMFLMACVAAVMYTESLIRPQYIDDMYCSAVQGSRLFTLCAMLCGLLTACISASGEQGIALQCVPLVLLALSVILVSAYTCRRMMRAGFARHQVMRVSTSACREFTL